MGQVPSAWNALPPLLHLANSYSSFKTHLKRRLLQEAFPDVPGCRPHLLCASLFLSQQPAFSLWLSLSECVAPTADCELLEGRARCRVPVCPLRCACPAPRGCPERLVPERCGYERRGDGSVGCFAIALPRKGGGAERDGGLSAEKKLG